MRQHRLHLSCQGPRLPCKSIMELASAGFMSGTTLRSSRTCRCFLRSMPALSRKCTSASAPSTAWSQRLHIRRRLCHLPGRSPERLLLRSRHHRHRRAIRLRRPLSWPGLRASSVARARTAEMEARWLHRRRPESRLPCAGAVAGLPQHPLLRQHRPRRGRAAAPSPSLRLALLFILTERLAVAVVIAPRLRQGLRKRSLSVATEAVPVEAQA